MGYIGENSYFSFRDGACEPLPERGLASGDMAWLGKVLAGQFRRFSVGCDGFSHTHLL